ncbi:hypothetical protein BAUCODRAFT_118509 [Baudoinia panamericana UAMH 10762]|uniref:DUF1857-domain-containing protein n=1 Tax=Baudoinia panamericana (strain UAMH 10762) TaxID=717646 RepID=M2M158_BAUPA|nr:uncharacterized protein BAUCODRAFT_118509 [Baudoinia panamericana UAMH 10762]EMD00773.1 hypothetical protein BAUCODRAFT_118509 [Baudoinia panamericana UAMH 10762]
MVVIYCAYSEPINPSGTSPVLSRDQIWQALQQKVRHPSGFVPIITGTDIIEDKGDEVTRIAHFQPPGKPAHSLREVCKSYYPTKIDFWADSGALVTNLVSDGPGLTEHDYQLTYIFEWRHPDVEQGSDEHKKIAEQAIKDAKQAVHGSIVAMRKMASEGKA